MVETSKILDWACHNGSETPVNSMRRLKTNHELFCQWDLETSLAFSRVSGSSFGWAVRGARPVCSRSLLAKKLPSQGIRPTVASHGERNIVMVEKRIILRRSKRMPLGLLVHVRFAPSWPSQTKHTNYKSCPFRCSHLQTVSFAAFAQLEVHPPADLDVSPDSAESPILKCAIGQWERKVLSLSSSLGLLNFLGYISKPQITYFWKGNLPSVDFFLLPLFMTSWFLLLFFAYSRQLHPMIWSCLHSISQNQRWTVYHFLTTSI